MAFSFSPKIVTDGLVLALDAANPKSYTSGSTVWTDLTANSNNGILINGTAFSSANAGILTFDGVDDYVDLSQTIQFNTSDFSISGWFRSNSGNTSYKQIWNSGYNGGSPDLEIGLLLGTNTLYAYLRPPNEVIPAVQTSYSVDDNVWRHFTVTRTSSTISLYVNGLFETSAVGSYNSDVDSAGVIPRIGNGLVNTNNRHFKGNIAQISAYNKALSATEILQNYNATKSRFNLR